MVYLFLLSYQLIVMLMFTMVLVTIITTTIPIVTHLSVVCYQLVIEELDVFVFSHLALGLLSLLDVVLNTECLTPQNVVVAIEMFPSPQSFTTWSFPWVREVVDLVTLSPVSGVDCCSEMLLTVPKGRLVVAPRAPGRMSI